MDQDVVLVSSMCVLDTYLICRRSMKLQAAHSDLCEKVVRGLKRLRTETLRPVGELMFAHRTAREMNYLEALRCTPSERIDAWCGASCIDPAAWVWTNLSF